jgi:N-acetylglucosamine kinase-like BadF-type ATPase
MIPAVLAVDGGNSKTDVALVAEDGNVLVAVRGPGACPPTAATLMPLVREVAARAGLTDGPVARHTMACVANVDLPEEEDALAAELARQSWSASTEVRNDTFAVLRAGSRRPWGVAVACGAGMNCVGVAPSGETARFLALGYTTGDWGGGLRLGKEMMFFVSRAEDGRGPDTLLRPLLAAHFGERTVHDVAVALHQGRIPESELVTLVPLLFQAAENGDEVAVRLVERQAEEVYLMARSAIDRLGIAADCPDIILGGGILAARSPLLVEGIERRIKQELPTATPCYVEIPPVGGAALLGLERIGAHPSAMNRLRAAYLENG